MLRTSILLHPKNASNVIKSCVVLHNFLLEKESTYLTSGEIDFQDKEGRLISGSWRNEQNKESLLSLGQASGNHSKVEARKMRDCLAKYFMSPEGEVPFQWKHAVGS